MVSEGKSNVVTLGRPMSGTRRLILSVQQMDAAAGRIPAGVASLDLAVGAAADGTPGSGDELARLDAPPPAEGA